MSPHEGKRMLGMPSRSGRARRVARARAGRARWAGGLLAATLVLLLCGTGPGAQGTALAAVPPATGNNAVITVKTGADRTGVTGVTGLAGVTLGFFANQTGGSPLFQCVSDADGDCSITVPDTQVGGANRNARYWVRELATPAGFSANQTLRTGNADGSGSQSTPYTFRTGSQLRAGTTYASTTDQTFMLGSGNSNRVASGGVWQSSRTNPVLPVACGLDVALVLDLSGSVGGAIGALRGASDTFTDALVGTPSRMSLFSFSEVSPATNASRNYPALTPVSTQAQANAFKSRYATWTPSGGTNWDRGIAVAAEANDRYDVVVVVTDGNPTRYDDPRQGPGSFTRLREVETGIFSANAVKARGTRVIAVGVGSGVQDSATGQNLASLSGPTKYDGSNALEADYYQSTDFAAAGEALRELALGNCAGSVSVVKQIVPSDTTGEDVTGAQPAGPGWEFGATTATPDIGGLPATHTTTDDGTGTVNFPLVFPDPQASASVTVNETQQAGYTVVTQGGRNATCTDLETGAPVPVTDDNGTAGRPGFTVDVASAAAISCIVYNRPPQPLSDITVDKTWVVNGTTYPEGAQPAGINAQLSLTGPGSAGATPQDWGVTRTGYTRAETATISESMDIDLPLCRLDSSRVTALNGAPVDLALPSAAVLDRAHVTAMVTNTVTCRSLLSLVKKVEGGDADPALWTLTAHAPDGALPGPAGATGSPGATDVDVTPDVPYQLSEDSPDPRYLQEDHRTDLEMFALATGSMSCVEIDAQRRTLTGLADGINGGVTVPLGTRVQCTATNQTAQVTLLKEVRNTHGGTATPADWQLTATPNAGVAGLEPTSVAGADTIAEVNTFILRPDHLHTLTEASEVTGYTNTALECRDLERTGSAYARVLGSVTVPVMDWQVCRFVNADVPAQLTLTKVVVNEHGGTATPADWTLTAAGPTPVRGPSGTAAVTAAQVSAGSYELAESGGPAGYTPSAWTCTGATLTGSTVTLTNGDHAECTITNRDGAPAVVPPPTGPSEPTDPPQAGPPLLPHTGAEVAPLLGGAILLLLAGAVSVLWARRSARGSR